jgi:hypothetical protein
LVLVLAVEIFWNVRNISWEQFINSVTFLIFGTLEMSFETQKDSKNLKIRPC